MRLDKMIHVISYNFKLLLHCHIRRNQENSINPKREPTERKKKKKEKHWPRLCCSPKYRYADAPDRPPKERTADIPRTGRVCVCVYISAPAARTFFLVVHREFRRQNTHTSHKTQTTSHFYPCSAVGYTPTHTQHLRLPQSVNSLDLWFGAVASGLGFHLPATKKLLRRDDLAACVRNISENALRVCVFAGVN